jgi:hypothetical protein
LPINFDSNSNKWTKSSQEGAKHRAGFLRRDASLRLMDMRLSPACRVSWAAISSCEGSYISPVTSRIAVRRPPRVHSPSERDSRRQTQGCPRGQGTSARALEPFSRVWVRDTGAAAMHQEARRYRSSRKDAIMASATPAALGRGHSTPAPKARHFESFGVMLRGDQWPLR